ncbi:hypothetical protein uan_021 [Pseudomonas phage UAntarctica]|nr:hypothetical protein uan_021 [Pseudomonas phage UAntarctica]
MKSNTLSKLLIPGGAFMHLPHEMFPSILNTNDDVPVKPRHSQSNWEAADKVASVNRLGAAEAKRERRAEKLRRLEARNG